MMNNQTSKPIAVIAGYTLIVPPQWHDLTDEERAGCCNGTGVDFMPAWLRAVYGWLTRQDAPSQPHDVGFTFACTWDDYWVRNCEYWHNCEAVDRQDLGKWRFLVAPTESTRRLFWRVFAFGAITVGAFFKLHFSGRKDADK